ncbi:peptidylprolyl isomerase [Miniphocaeibacter massiliensis]|uniref:peptidylprolyl isomerase n=1 Tax=Miniphocaeibacter massiliensis TaxID=2041841 RepID=UPI000C07AEC3|nr:peptidylprolyl isomerase [Miniphocaeibacter massiliensis]
MIEQLRDIQSGDLVAGINTSLGTIKVRLFPEIAPLAVENFKTLSEQNYYNDIIFHRVIKDFMIQTGDPEGTGMGGNSIWNKPFNDEFNINYRNFRGALSMANAGSNTNGSQFFIVQKDSTEPSYINQMREAGEDNGYPKEIVDKYEEIGGTFWLDYKHTVFGQVIEGMDIVDKIANTEVGRNDKPVHDIKILNINIIEVK